jgi:non-ribosomal peptide synthetase component F
MTATASLSLKDSQSRMATAIDLEKIAEFNRTEVPFPDQATLQELIEAQFAKKSVETAVICDHDLAFGVPSLSYAQLNERANQLAHLLRAAGVGPGAIVALIVERSFAMMIGILGIVKSGGAYLPLPVTTRSVDTR